MQEQLDLVQMEFREEYCFLQDERQSAVELQWRLFFLPVQKLLVESVLLAELVELVELGELAVLVSPL